VEGILPFPAALASAAPDEAKVVFWEGVGSFGLKKVLAPLSAARTVALLVGPEGGFSEEEVGEAERAGFVRAGLGKRILRVETAAVAALAMVTYHFEND
jgi:16S rRNA (uracil1498-N3)-methyltransferase